MKKIDVKEIHYKIVDGIESEYQEEVREIVSQIQSNPEEKFESSAELYAHLIYEISDALRTHSEKHTVALVQKVVDELQQNAVDYDLVTKKSN